MKTHTKTLLTALACSAGLTLSASGDVVLVSYEFLDNDVTQTTGTATGSDVTYGAFTGFASGSFGTSSFSDTLFIRASATGATAADGDTLAEAITNNAYAGFTLTNSTASSIDLGSFSFDIWFTSPNADSGANTYEMYVMSDAAAFTAGNELGGVVYDYNTETTAVTPPIEAAPATIVTDLSSLGNLATSDSIAFRIYFVDSSDNGDPIFRVDNITVSAAVIPEPGSLALLGLGGLCLIKRRRRD